MEAGNGDVVVQLLSCAQLFVTPSVGACQTPLSMGLSSQEYWSELPVLQGIFLTQGSNVCLLHWQEMWVLIMFLTECPTIQFSPE